jgi:hypothetical protein
MCCVSACAIPAAAAEVDRARLGGGGASGHERYRLKPELFPRSQELNLSPQALLALQELSKRSGRSMGEIAEEIISKNLDSPPKD